MVCKRREEAGSARPSCTELRFGMASRSHLGTQVADHKAARRAALRVDMAGRSSRRLARLFRWKLSVRTLILDFRGEVSPGLGVEGQHWSLAVIGIADENAADLARGCRLRRSCRRPSRCSCWCARWRRLRPPLLSNFP